MNEDLKLKLATYDTVINIPVAWGHMDAFQHVNNVAYFRYLESVRIAYFEKAGFVSEGMHPRIGPILASTSCRFKAPMTYPDTAIVGCRIGDIGKDRYMMEKVIVSERLQCIAAVGTAEIVSYDYEKGRKVDLPEAWLSILQNGKK